MLSSRICAGGVAGVAGSVAASSNPRTPLIPPRPTTGLSPRIGPVDASRPTAEGERAHAEHTAVLMRRMGIIGAAVVMVATLVWWPLDGVLMADAAHRDAFFVLRLRAVAVTAIGIALLAVHRPRPIATATLGTAVYAVFMAAIGASLARITPADLALFADASVGIVPMVLAPMRAVHRALATFVVGLALALGFFGTEPAHLAAPGAGVQISFLVFTCMLTIALGSVLTHVDRARFFERRALDEANARLAELRDELQARVDLQTQDLRALAHHLDTVQEHERRRIARDLHDDLGQQLAAMRYAVARLEGRLDPQADETTFDLVDDLSALLDGTATSVRAVIARLRPRILDDLGVVAAVQWLCDDVAERADIACVFDDSALTDDARTLTPEQEMLVFRVVQEATTNALKHAGASRIDVRIERDAERVLVEVRDDGRGFDPSAVRDGFGLIGARERLANQGGQLDVRSAPGEGTTVVAQVPLVSTDATDPTEPTGTP